jgi:ABC-type multidrug transport system ATPase subunit
MNAISIKCVGVTFDKRSPSETIALKCLSFDLELGKVVVLKGANGSGKTTLLRLLAGLLKPTNGRIEVPGQKSPREYLRNKIAFLRQRVSDGLVTTLSLAENVALLTRHSGAGFLAPYIRNKNFRDLESKLISKVPFYARARSRRVLELSGGEQQRFAIALARLQGRPVVLLDEPTASLDPVSYDWVRREIMDWLMSAKLTAVIVTHDPRLIVDLSGSVYELMQTPTSSEIRFTGKSLLNKERF